jgi:nucleoside-diphosphate-sugar epimerase
MEERKTAVVLGAGGFIGSHMVKRLKAEGYFVRGVDLKAPEFSKSEADEFYISDLRYYDNVLKALTSSNSVPFDEVYQFAADMGGAGYIFTGENDADVMHNSAAININVAKICANILSKSPKVFYSSSACIYPERNQLDPENPLCSEDSAYPAAPDSEYGWEKLFSERLYQAFSRNHGLNVRIARFHNIYGPEGTWTGGKEKAPAAMCRKVAEIENGFIEVWGKGDQTRSFLYIDDCIEAVRRLMNSECTEVINIGSEEMVTINQLANLAIDISGKDIELENVPGPEGVRGRNSDNTLIKEYLNWDYEYSLEEGMNITYNWIESQIKRL